MSTQAMLNKPFFVALRRPIEPSRIQEILPRHLEWVIAAEQRGEVFASGPFVSDDAQMGALGGMTILRAASLEDAKRLIAEDPFVRHGIYAVEVRKWLLMEGGFSINVSFSDRQYRLL